MEEQERALAYSYVRFSSSKQAAGDSLRRQTALAEAYCRENSLTLAALKIHDLGVSGFRSDNSHKGELSAFIEAVETGVVAPGSWLIIENFDRLSRDHVPVALQLMLRIVELGIVIATLVDRKVWNRQTVKETMNLMGALMSMNRAHEESMVKSARLRAVWQEKKKRAATTGEVISARGPGWLRAIKVEGVKKWEVLPDVAQSVRKCFELKAAGLGVRAIASRANKERWPQPAPRKHRSELETDEQYEARNACWHPAGVHKILKNRAVLGEYVQYNTTSEIQLEGGGSTVVKERKTNDVVVQNYYPAIVEPALFASVAAAAARRGPKPGRRDEQCKNWLQGIAVCDCGRPLARRNSPTKSKYGGDADYSRFYCAGRVRSDTKCESIRAQSLEYAVLAAVHAMGADALDTSGTVRKLQGQLDELELKLTKKRTERERLISLVAATELPIPGLAKKLDEVQADILGIELTEAALRAELDDASEPRQDALESVLAGVGSKGEDAVMERAKLRENLARLVHKVEVSVAENRVSVYFKAEKIVVHQPLGNETGYALPN